MCEFVSTINKDDEIILVGGDGTLNHFANYVYGKGFENNFYLFRAGTGNDFVKKFLFKPIFIIKKIRIYKL